MTVLKKRVQELSEQGSGQVKLTIVWQGGVGVEGMP